MTNFHMQRWFSTCSRRVLLATSHMLTIGFFYLPLHLQWSAAHTCRRLGITPDFHTSRMQMTHSHALTINHLVLQVPLKRVLNNACIDRSVVVALFSLYVSRNRRSERVMSAALRSLCSQLCFPQFASNSRRRVPAKEVHCTTQN